MSRQNKTKTSLLAAYQEPSVVLKIVNQYSRWITLIIVAIVALLCYTLVLQEKISSIRSVAQENLPSKQRIYDDLQLVKKDIDGMVNEYESIKEKKADIFDRINKVLPTKDSYGDLFTTVDALARDNGMILNSISIALEGGQVTTATNPAAFQPITPTSATEKPLLGSVKQMTVTISVSAGPGYDNYKKMLEALEQNVRLFDVHSISYSEEKPPTPGEGIPATPEKPALKTYTFDLTTYYRDQ